MTALLHTINDPADLRKLARQQLLQQALCALDASGLGHTQALRALADMVVNRAH